MAVNLPPMGELVPVKGMRLGSACAGIKQKVRNDVTVILLDEGTTVAGVFTRSSFAAAPVQICRQVLAAGGVRALVINSGNANAATGEPGRVDAGLICDQVAMATNDGFSGAQVLPFSTGVIGQRLPVERMNPAVAEAAAKAKPEGWEDAALAIMTTDTGPKALSRTVEINGVEVTITGICKGAGMIKPDMATMLAYIGCDAAVSDSCLQRLAKRVADKSFNRVTVDGDTSTNDSFVICATGAADVAITDLDSAEGQLLETAMTGVALELAQRIIRDAEGATKFVTVRVSGAQSAREALNVAYTVAESPLVKTAIFAGDPNWGRFCMAIGRSGIPDLDTNRVSVHLDAVCIARGGQIAAEYVEENAARVMAQDEFVVHIDLGRGEYEETVWTADLSYEYVRINAEYRS
ncbi:MAG: bifunctional glutamate N-acetyltransferase/amino-acid acetyltransferase ArgJ [Proteobacteria bacterium]|nr:bifunctional glutamate N-acetyltransferase/amino-acid acetyltransferase ArgJ [Pseudomonadota bacterium]